MTTFLDQYFNGEVDEDGIHAWVERWHNDDDLEMQLHEYLGLTWPEYGIWASAGLLPLPATRLLPMKSEVLQGGEVIFAHGPGVCDGPPCPVHWPSDHHMRTWKQHWCRDRGIMERLCPGGPDHGIGHPDPDDRNRDKVHRCDGCCIRPVTPILNEEDDEEDPECSCAMSESSMVGCPVHGYDAKEM